MLNPYLRKADTSSLSSRINLKLLASDTSSLSTRINLKLSAIDTSTLSNRIDTKATISANLNDQTSTTYTVLATDNGKVITFDNASAIILTVPTGLSAGFNCMIVQKGAGEVTISGAGGITVTNRNSFTKTAGQNAIVSLIGLSATYFITGGDMQ